MRARRFRKMSRVVLAVVIAAMATMLSHASGASATEASEYTTTTLPAGFDAIVTDPTTHRVFVSDVASLAITAFDENGAVVAHLDPAGPGTMVVHDGRLYAASAHYTSIFTYDTSSLQAVSVLAQNQVLSPAPALAWANGRLWTTTGDCHAGASQIMSVEPDTGNAVVHDPIPGLTGCVDLVSSPRDPTMLIGFEPGAQFMRLVRLDVSTGAPVVQADSPVDCYNPEQVAFTFDGSSVLAACGSPYHLVELSPDALEETGRVYQTGAYPAAVAIDPRFGQIAAGVSNDDSNTDIQVFQPGASSPSWTDDFGGDRYPHASLVTRGLAWDADGNTLYAVSKDVEGAFRLHVVAGATSTTVIASPPTITYGQSTTLMATVRGAAPGQYPPDGDVTFTDGTTVLGHAQLNGGSATMVPSSLAVGTHSVVASFAGTRSGAPSASAPLTVQVQPAPTTTHLEQWDAYQKTLPGQPVRLTVNVTPAANPNVAQGTVTVYDGDKALTTETVYGGVDYPVVTLYSVGVHHLHAVYSGDTNYSGSTSNTVDHSVVLCQDVLQVASANAPQLCPLTPLPQ